MTVHANRKSGRLSSKFISQISSHNPFKRHASWAYTYRIRWQRRQKHSL